MTNCPEDLVVLLGVPLPKEAIGNPDNFCGVAACDCSAPTELFRASRLLRAYPYRNHSKIPAAAVTEREHLSSAPTAWDSATTWGLLVQEGWQCTHLMAWT